MKARLIAIMAAVAALACSCGERIIEVTDTSFRISAQAVFSEENLASTLYLTLEKGCRDDQYQVSCTIDGNPGTSFDSSVKFSASGRAEIPLPELEVGSHRLGLEYSTDNYRQEDVCVLEVTLGKFDIHAEVSTESSTRSALLVSLVQGRATEVYSVKVTSEGETIAKMDGIDFRSTPIVSIPLPLMRPGSYNLDVSASDGRTDISTRVSFREPLRYTEVNMEIARSSSTGKTRFRVTSNPYDLSVAVYDSLVVKGRCDYHVCSYIEDRLDYKTSYLVNCDIVDLPRFQPSTGTWYNLTDTQTKEDLITNQRIANSTWRGHWDDSGEGGWQYAQEPDGYSYYTIESSAHHMTLAFEVIDGITVNVTNSERDVFINKVAVPVGRYSYRLR